MDYIWKGLYNSTELNSLEQDKCSEIFYSKTMVVDHIHQNDDHRHRPHDDWQAEQLRKEQSTSTWQTQGA